MTAPRPVRWPLSRLVPWPAQVFVLLPFALGLAALFVTVRTNDLGVTKRDREQKLGAAALDAFFGGSAPGHEVRWSWLLWTARVLLTFAVLAAVVGGVVWRSRVKRDGGRSDAPERHPGK